jgi:hypothetical protein
MGGEGFFAKIRIANRYDKLATTFLAFIITASMMLWLE